MKTSDFTHPLPRRSLASLTTLPLPGWAVLLLATGLALATLFFRLLLAAQIGERPFLVMFIIPIIFSAYLGGFRAGSWATVVIGLGTWYFLVFPQLKLQGLRVVDGLQWLIFILAGILVSALSEALHQARQRAEDHERLTKLTLASIGDGVITIDAQGAVTFLNQEAERLSGWSCAAALGQPLSAVFQVESQQQPASIEQLIQQVLTTRLVANLPNDAVLRARDGRIVPIDDSLAPLTLTDGRVQGAVLIFRDASKARETAAVLRERAALQEQLASIVAALPGVIYSFQLRPDGSSSVPFASPKLEELCELHAATLTQDAAAMFDRVHPADRERLHASIQASAVDLTPWHCEFRVERPVQGEAWIEGNALPQREPDGSTLWHGVLINITRRKQTELSLAESRQLHQAVLDSLTSAIAVLDRTGVVIDANEVWRQEVLKQAAQPLNWASYALGQNCLQPLPAASSSSLLAHCTNIEAGLRAVLDGRQERFVYEYECQSLTGRRWYLLTSMRLLHEAGGAVVAHREITERKVVTEALRQSEAQLQLGVNVAGLALAEIDFLTDTIWLRAQTAALLGFSSAAQTIRMKAFYALIHLDDRARVKQLMERSLDEQSDGRMVAEYRIVRPDGQVRWLTVHGQTVFSIDAEGERRPARAHLAAQDVTERKLAEVTLHLSEERLRAFLRIISDSRVSHTEKINQLLALGTQQFGMFTGLLVNVAQRKYRVTHVHSLDHSVKLGESGEVQATLYEEVLQRNEILAQEKARPLADISPGPQLPGGAVACFSMPVRVENHVYGALCFFSRFTRSTPFSNGDREFLRLMAQWIGAELTRQRAEVELRNSEERQRLALEAGKMGTWCWFPETGEIELDENCRQLLGLTTTHLQNPREAFAKVAHPDDFELVRSGLLNAWKKQQPYSVEYRIVCPDQSIQWRSAIGRAFYHNNEKFAGFNGVVFDITERKRAEEALRESEVRFRALFEQSAVGKLIINEATDRVLDCNTAAAELLGYSPTELLAVPKRDSAYNNGLTAHIQLALENASDQQLQFETTCLTRTGEPKDVIVVGRRIRLQGEWLSYISILDVTEKKRAEAELQRERDRLANIAAASPSAIYSFCLRPDGHYSYPYVSQAFSDLYGLPLEDVRRDARITDDRVHSDDKRGLLHSILASAKHMTRWQHVWRVNHPIKGELWIEGFAAPVREADGSIIWHGILNDVTERQRAEQDLRESEARFRVLADSAPVLIWMTGTDGHCNYFNRGWLEFTGRSLEEELRRSRASDSRASDIHPEEAESCLTIYQTAFNARHTFEMEYRLRRADGEYRWLLDKGVPRWTPSGEFIGYIGTCVDITERKQAADAVNRSRAQLEAVFQAIEDGLVVADMQGKFLLVNDAEAQICGFSTPAELQQNLSYFLEVFVLANPDGQPLPFEEWPLSRILRGQSIKDYELLGRRLDTGQEWFFSYSGEPVWDENGEQILAVISTRDITKRKRAETALQKQEHWYRALIEHSSDSIAVINASNQIVYVSPAVQEIEGYTPDELIGTDMSKHTNPEDLPYVREMIQRLLSQPGKTLPVLWRRQHKNGAWLWLEGVSTNLLDDPAVQGIVTNYRDVTSRKSTEEQLLKSEEQLRQLASHLQTVREEERTNIAREIHDELGQMLTAVRMNLKWIEKEVPVTALSTRRRLADTVELVGQTIQTVRRISTSLHPTILDDFGLLAALEWQIKEFQKHSGIRCEFKFTPLPVELERNCALAIFRICQETLTNVARHAQASFVEINLTVDTCSLCLRIRDNGRGISTEVLTQRRSLGLVSMRERAQSFGGIFEFSGQPGQGTTVKVKIPILGGPLPGLNNMALL